MNSVWYQTASAFKSYRVVFRLFYWIELDNCFFICDRAMLRSDSRFEMLQHQTGRWCLDVSEREGESEMDLKPKTVRQSLMCLQLISVLMTSFWPSNGANVKQVSIRCRRWWRHSSTPTAFYMCTHVVFVRREDHGRTTSHDEGIN